MNHGDTEIQRRKLNHDFKTWKRFGGADKRSEVCVWRPRSRNIALLIPEKEWVFRPQLPTLCGGAKRPLCPDLLERSHGFRARTIRCRLSSASSVAAVRQNARSTSVVALLSFLR